MIDVVSGSGQGGRRVRSPPVGFTHDVANVRSAKVHALGRWWASQVRPDAPVPRRAGLEPSLLKPLLPELLVAEFVPGGRVRYRLVGTRVVEYSRLDFTGMFIDELQFNDPMDWMAAYRTLQEDPRPLYGTTAVLLSDGTYSPYEFGMFPLSFDGHRIVQVVALEDYGNPDPLTAWSMTPVRRQA